MTDATTRDRRLTVNLGWTLISLGKAGRTSSYGMAPCPAALVVVAIQPVRTRDVTVRTWFS